MSKNITLQQDCVDNAILTMLTTIIEETTVKLVYGENITAEDIGLIRDAVEEVLCKRLRVLTPAQFYPEISS